MSHLSGRRRVPVLFNITLNWIEELCLVLFARAGATVAAGAAELDARG